MAESTGFHHNWLTSTVKANGRQVPMNLPESPEEAWSEVVASSGLSESELMNLLSGQFGLNVADLANIELDAVELIPERIARRYSSLPVSSDGHTLHVATARPFDSDMINVMSFTSGLHIEVVLASPEAVQNAIVSHYSKVKDREAKSDISGVSSRQDYAQPGTESAIAQMVAHMIGEAHELQASDIHIEPFVGGGIIRYRIDGMLRRVTTLPAPVLQQMLQRVKAICAMNVTNHHITQDGNTEVDLNGKKLDVRVSVIPVIDGEKIVLRLLDGAGSAQTIDDIGFSEHETSQLRNLALEQSGIFIVTGPTGSGKSSTLYALLREINTVDRCLVTVEDPVEFQIEGVAQISVNESHQVTFASALRSVLRQDPDAILVGEIRDEETASMALRAALTGHFVLSTMHTRDALSSISRLLDLGVSRTVLADSLGVLAAQRLVRKLCSSCRTRALLEEGMAQKLASLRPDAVQYAAAGCDACGFDGYKGRAPIIELVPVTLRLSDGIRSGLSVEELRALCLAEGVRFLPDAALNAIETGLTGVTEVNRVLGSDFWSLCAVNA